MKKIDELTKKLLLIQEKANKIRVKILNIERDKKLKNSQKYIGKYYKETSDRHSDDFINCVYVYGVNKLTCELESISVTYWISNEKYFSIESQTNFSPSEKIGSLGWKSITKKEFDKHLKIVQNKIITFLKK